MAKSRRVRSRRGLYAWGLKPPTTQGGGGAIPCAYPLDASLAEIQSIGFTGKPVLTNGDMTGTLTISDVTQNLAASASGIATGTGVKVSRASGKMAIELQIGAFPVPANTSTGNTQWGAGLTLLDSTLSEIYTATVTARDNGTVAVSTQDSFAVGGFQITGLTAAPSELALVLDYDVGEIYMRVDGVNYDPTPFTATEYTIASRFFEQNTPQDAGDVGKLVTATVVTDSSNYTGAYESGTTDPCGNPV